jgi:hypothetical protein
MKIAPHEAVCDRSDCPECAAENAALGGGSGFADWYVNVNGGLWAVCAVHRTRWYVTRSLLGWPEVTEHSAVLRSFRAVEPAVDRRGGPTGC